MCFAGIPTVVLDDSLPFWEVFAAVCRHARVFASVEIPQPSDGLAMPVLHVLLEDH